MFHRHEVELPMEMLRPVVLTLLDPPRELEEGRSPLRRMAQELAAM